MGRGLDPDTIGCLRTMRLICFLPKSDEGGYGQNMNESGTLFFVLMAGLAGIMTLVYFPLRIFLTATARSRRLRLLQRIRRLRDELGQPIKS